MDIFSQVLAFVVALIAGAIASISGFGIGSLLTPLLAMHMDMKVAVAIVTIPHFIATALRFWMLRSDLRKSILFHFGVLSAAGGVFGAAMHNSMSSPVLKLVFACILIFAGVSGLTGLTAKVHLGKKSGWIAGALSGVFGGLVGSQGSIRSAALLAFDMPKEQFVATATAVGLVVDVARMPIYMLQEHDAILSQMPIIVFLTIGCLIGTVIGGRLLKRVPRETFTVVVSTLILLLGVSIWIGG